MGHSAEDRRSLRLNGVMTDFLKILRWNQIIWRFFQGSESEWRKRKQWIDFVVLQEPKPLLKLVMNPRGQVQDWHQLKQAGIYSEPSALSPEICHDIVKDLHSPSGKGKSCVIILTKVGIGNVMYWWLCNCVGAQLFAKRRKKSENWVVDETNVRRSSTEFSTGSSFSPSYPRPANQPNRNSPGGMPPASFIDRTRVEHTQKLNQIQVYELQNLWPHGKWND